MEFIMVTPRITNHNKFKHKVSETLLIPLVCKAEETQMPDPIIKDDIACYLLQRIDFDITKFKNKKASRTGTAIRAKYFDNEITEFIIKHNTPLIITLGCGLDARYDRLPSLVKEKALFVYLDFNDVIELRKALIPERKNEKYLSGDMLSNDWIKEFKSITPKKEYEYMFILEGVIMYIPEDKLKIFFNMLCHEFKSGIILFDNLSTFLTSKSEKHDTVKHTDAKFIFGSDDDNTLEKWNDHLVYRKTKLFTDFKESRRMGLILSLLMKFLPKYKYSSRMLTYQIKHVVNENSQNQ